MSLITQALLGKIESPADTDANPTASDAIKITSASISIVPTIIKNEEVKQTFGAEGQDVASMMYELNVEFKIKGSGTPGTAPEWSPLAHCSGFDVSTIANTSTTIAPITKRDNKSTFNFYDEGLLYKLVGGVGKMTKTADINGYYNATVTVNAPYVAPIVAAIPANLVNDPSTPVLFSTASAVTEAGNNIACGSFSIDDGASVIADETSEGLVYLFEGRDPTLTINKNSLGTVTDFNNLANSTSIALTINLSKGAGNILNETIAVAKLNSLGLTSENVQDKRELTYSLFESTSDDQDIMVFT